MKLKILPLIVITSSFSLTFSAKADEVVASGSFHTTSQIHVTDCVIQTYYQRFGQHVFGVICGGGYIPQATFSIRSGSCGTLDETEGYKAECFPNGSWRVTRD